MSATVPTALNAAQTQTPKTEEAGCRAQFTELSNTGLWALPLSFEEFKLASAQEIHLLVWCRHCRGIDLIHLHDRFRRIGQSETKRASADVPDQTSEKEQDLAVDRTQARKPADNKPTTTASGTADDLMPLHAVMFNFALEKLRRTHPSGDSKPTESVTTLANAALLTTSAQGDIHPHALPPTPTPTLLDLRTQEVTKMVADVTSRLVGASDGLLKPDGSINSEAVGRALSPRVRTFLNTVQNTVYAEGFADRRRQLDAAFTASAQERYQLSTTLF